MKNILSRKQILNLKQCGHILAIALNKVESRVQAGVTTKELDEIAEKSIRSQGAKPSFLGYNVVGIGKYPASICISINEEIVHGIPKEGLVIKDGDIVSLDLGAKFKGICTDMAITVPVGAVSEESKRLIEVTKKCLSLGIDQAKAGNKIGAIGEAVQKYAEANNFGVVRDLVGHGIGEKPHMDPKIPNYGTASEGPEIQENMALAIEPMITAGDFRIKTGDDNWTIKTSDNSLAAHFEHTIVIENGKPVIVTL